MLNFKDFTKENISSEKNVEKENKEEFSKKQYDDAMNVINKYKGYSEEDLMREIAKTIKTQKQQNVYNKNNVLKQLDLMSGFIPPDKIEKLKNILDEQDDA